MTEPDNITALLPTNLPTLNSINNLCTLESLNSLLTTAADADQRYDSINTAKLRSVEQHQDYDQFRNMVLGAHLKPVDLSTTPLNELAKPKSINNNPSVVTNNTTATTAALLANNNNNTSNTTDITSITQLKSIEQSEQRSRELLLSTLTEFKHPAESHQLVRDWNRLGSIAHSNNNNTNTANNNNRYNYLLQLQIASINKLFKTGSGLELLGEFITVIQAQFDSKSSNDTTTISIAEYRHFYELLRELAAIDRFQMSIAFLSSIEINSLKSIFTILADKAPNDSENTISTATATATTAATATTTTTTELTTAVSQLNINNTSANSSNKSQSTDPMLLPGWSGINYNNNNNNSKKSTITTANISSNMTAVQSTAINNKYSNLIYTKSNVDKLQSIYISIKK